MKFMYEIQTTEVVEMKINISEEDTIVFKGKEFNGKEISYADLTRFLTERIVLKRQMALVTETYGGVSNE